MEPAIAIGCHAMPSNIQRGQVAIGTFQMWETRRDTSGAWHAVVTSFLPLMRGGGDRALIVVRLVTAPVPPTPLQSPSTLHALLIPTLPFLPSTAPPLRAGVDASAKHVRQTSSEAPTSQNARGANVVSQAAVHKVQEVTVGTPACPKRIVPVHSPAVSTKVDAVA